MRLSQLTAVRWSWKLPANCGAVRSHDLLGERCICWGGGLSLCVDLSASKGQVAAAGGDCVLQGGRPGARSPDGFHQTPNITLQFVLTGSPTRLSSFTVK